ATASPIPLLPPVTNTSLLTTCPSCMFRPKRRMESPLTQGALVPITPREIAAAWRRERPGIPTRSIPAVSAIKRAAKQLARTREHALRELGVDAATLDLLSTLRRTGAPYTLSTREIAEQALITAGA